MSLDAQPKRKLRIVKRDENVSNSNNSEDGAQKQEISTLRDRFRASISPFLLTIHIHRPDSPNYVIVDSFIPQIPDQDPVRVYTWLDSSLSDAISAVFAQEHPSIPQEWTKLTISTVYIVSNAFKQDKIMTLTPDDYLAKHKTLLECRLEIGDHLEFHFESTTE